MKPHAKTSELVTLRSQIKEIRIKQLELVKGQDELKAQLEAAQTSEGATAGKLLNAESFISQCLAKEVVLTAAIRRALGYCHNGGGGANSREVLARWVTESLERIHEPSGPFEAVMVAVRALRFAGGTEDCLHPLEDPVRPDSCYRCQCLRALREMCKAFGFKITDF